MDSLTELLKKYYGYGANDELGLTESTSSDGGLGLDMGVQNQSLLGSDRRTNNTLSLMGLLGSPEALTGLGLISAGSQGKRIGESILPAFTEGLKVSSAVRTMTKEQEQQKAIDEFASQVPEQYKPLFKAFPKETMKLLLTPKTPTLSGEALKVASELQGLNATDFKEAFGKLSKVKQDLYNKEIAGNQDIVSQLLAMSGGNLADFAQKQKGVTTTAAAPIDIKSTDVFKKYKEANPNVSDELLIDAIKKKFPNK
jgi:hypothetical protein